jgi:HAE1 family hydrophobic/amphiphilic exporter-1
MNRPMLITLLLALLLVPPTLAAGTRTLTLDDALALAAENNRDIAKARQYQEYVRGRYIEERSAAFPQLSLDASHMKADDETQEIFADALTGGAGGFSFPTKATTRMATIGVTQALYTWGQVGAAIRGAKFAIAGANDQLRRFRQATRRDVTATFHDILLARELAAIAKQNVEQKARHLDEAQRKLKLGTATDYDVLAADVALQNARPDAIRAEQAVQSARDRLRFLLAIEDDVDVTGSLAASSATPEAAPAYAETLATAISNRPDLAAQQNQTAVYKELVQISKAGDKPRFDFKGGWGWKDWDLDIARSRGKTWSAGVYLHFPFFDGLKTHGKTVSATSDWRTQQLAEARLRDQVGLDVREALHAVDVSGSVVRALTGTVAQAERLEQMAEKGFELGVKTRLDVDDAQLNLMQARGNLARAQRDYLVARVTLKYVTGTLD